MTALTLWLQENVVQSLGLSSPFCPLYLLPALAAALLWLCQSQSWSLRQAALYLRQKSWEHRHSIRTDGLWALFQLLLLRTPIALLHVALFHWAYEQLAQFAGHSDFGLYTLTLVEALLGTVISMLAIDLAAYVMHRALHAWPQLWWIHRLHHEARFLTPLSTLRQHPLEPLLLNGARGLAAGLSLGGLHLLFPNATPILTVAGMGPGFFLYMFTVNLHHAPIPLRYPRCLRGILISPHIHHLHHSSAPEHYGKNFGVIFSIWDRCLGTYQDQEVGLEDLQFGVGP